MKALSLLTLVCVCCSCSVGRNSQEQSPANSAESKEAGAVVVHYPAVYIDFYRGFLQCGGIRQRSDLVVDTLKDPQLVAFYERLANDIHKETAIEGGDLDARLCVDLLDAQGNTEAMLSIGWIAIWDSTYTPKNVDPRKNIWYPFCQLDGVGVVELDSLQGALVLQSLPPDYLAGSVLDEATRLPATED